MNRFLGKLGRRDSTPTASREASPDRADDSPEAMLLRELTTFCDSNSGTESTQGEEFVHLPRIVEIAESSPAAAKEAAYRIRKYLSAPTNTPNHVQYNAIMVMRILVDNPGHTFTRNFDSKFVAAVKENLRYGRDWHVQHYLRQYLNTLENTHKDNVDLQPLLQMWSKEKQKGDQSFNNPWPHGGHGGYVPPVPWQRPQRQAPPKTLPDPGELAARVEEARNSANLLQQFVQMTPVAEMEDNELVKEFVDRCRTSSRLIQSYIHSTNPTPDEETLLTLIECNDEISRSLSQQQRAMLQARKLRGSASPSGNSNSSANADTTNGTGPVSPVNDVVASGARPGANASPLIDFDSTAMTGGRITDVQRDTHQDYEYNPADFEDRNPFGDEYAEPESSSARERNVRFQSTDHP